MEPLRIALYSHDSLGLGHARRNLALAYAFANQLPGLTGRAVTGLLITGTAVAPGFHAPTGWDWVLLPGVDKGTNGYQPRNLNMHIKDLVSLRGAVLEGFLTGFHPDLIIIDRHATGIHGELEVALNRVRAHRGVRTVLGLREILDSPIAALAEWDRLGGPGVVRKLFDEIWVYGDPSIHDPVAAGEIPFSLRGMIRYTGYLATGRSPGSVPTHMPAPFVMTTVGGGSDGRALAGIAARTTLPVGLRHLIVTGPQMPATDLCEIRGLAAATGATVVANLDDVVGHLRQASAVISMGGYNSVCEIMSTDIPALVVPREHSRAEQLIRARSLARDGYLQLRRIGTLTPQILADWLAQSIGTRVDRSRILLNGLNRVPQLAADLLQGGPLIEVLPLPSRTTGGAARVAV